MIPIRRPALALLAWLALALPLRAEGVTVFAAASLKTALDEVAAAWSAEGGTEVTLAYAGSSALARQIAGGAPADIFISASAAWMDDLAARGAIVAESQSDLLGNTLVLIGHGRDMAPVALAEGSDLPQRLGEGRLAMALVDAVPAGIYGREALVALGLWDRIAPRVAQTDNVRAALALVATGEAPMGIVYATDAAAEPRVAVLGRFPEGSHGPIVYPAALVAGHGAAAPGFLDFLGSATARALFEAQGFRLLR